MIQGLYSLLVSSKSYLQLPNIIPGIDMAGILGSRLAIGINCLIILLEVGQSLSLAKPGIDIIGIKLQSLVEGRD